MMGFGKLLHTIGSIVFKGENPYAGGAAGVQGNTKPYHGPRVITVQTKLGPYNIELDAHGNHVRSWPA